MISLDEDRTTIRITRGDSTGSYNNKLCFCCPYFDAKSEEEKFKTISLNDVISFVVYEKKGYTKREILRKNYTLRSLGYTSGSKYPELPLEEIDTKKFPLKNKPTTYWYNIVLNNTNTVVGHDENSKKKIIVYPETEEE